MKLSCLSAACGTASEGPGPLSEPLPVCGRLPLLRTTRDGITSPLAGPLPSSRQSPQRCQLRCGSAPARPSGTLGTAPTRFLASCTSTPGVFYILPRPRKPPYRHMIIWVHSHPSVNPHWGPAVPDAAARLLRLPLLSSASSPAALRKRAPTCSLPCSPAAGSTRGSQAGITGRDE